jgi:hypothetical protein
MSDNSCQNSPTIKPARFLSPGFLHGDFVVEKLRLDLRTEVELTFAQAKKYLSSDELEAWRDCRYTFRCLAHYNKIFILYAMLEGEPSIRGSITVLEPHICKNEGIGMQVRVDLKTGATYEVSVIQAPTPVYEEKVFIHVPFNVTAFYLPRHQRMILQIPVVVKTQAKPWDAYGVRVLGLSAFKKEFPQYDGVTL